jgi:hypothetical protein
MLSPSEVAMKFFNTMRPLVIAALLLTPALLFAVPYTFSSGQVISAAQINANFAALDSEISALSGADRSNLIRVTTAIAFASPVPVITIPSSAARPYLLREVMMANLANVTCALTANGTENIPLSGPVVGLSVPFSAGEQLTAVCSGSAGTNFTFVFEK